MPFGGKTCARNNRGVGSLQNILTEITIGFEGLAIRRHAAF